MQPDELMVASRDKTDLHEDRTGAGAWRMSSFVNPNPVWVSGPEFASQLQEDK